MRQIFSHALSGLLALTALPGMGAAQTTAPRPSAEAPSASLAPGARVRITYRRERPWTGVLVRQNADTLIVRTASGTRYDPCWLDFSGKYPSPPEHDRAPTGAIVGGVAGAVLGYITGQRPSEKWHRLSLEAQRMRISASPRRGGSLAVALAF